MNEKRYYENDDFRYDSITGDLYHNRNKCSRAKKGQLCGQSLNNNGYKQVKLNDKNLRHHRVIWWVVHGYWPNEIDHINGIVTDNRLTNLREVTRTENCRNARKSCRNKSGVTGVYFYKKAEKWQAQIYCKGSWINLGLYTHFKDAVRARKAAEKRYGYHPNHGLAQKERSEYV